MAKAKGKGGRPIGGAKYQPDFHAQDFIERSKQGQCISEIASDWGTHRQKLYEWAEKDDSFREAMRIGKTHLEAWWAKFGRAVAAGKVDKANATLFVWMTKNQLGWSDRVTLTEEPIDGLDFLSGEDDES